MCKLRFISFDFNTMYLNTKRNARIISGQPRINFIKEDELNLINIYCVGAVLGVGVTVCVSVGVGVVVVLGAEVGTLLVFLYIKFL